jgi:hypothetical protein
MDEDFFFLIPNIFLTFFLAEESDAKLFVVLVLSSLGEDGMDGDFDSLDVGTN